MSKFNPDGSRRKSTLESREAYDEMELEEEEVEYYFPHVEVVEIFEDPAQNLVNNTNRRRPAPRRPPRNPPGSRPAVKMYQLDPDVYPEAANARASYVNRVKRKAEKNQILNEIQSLRQRNKELEDENKLLKEQLSNIRPEQAAKGSNDWLTFFRKAGIKSGIDVKYALVFERNRVQRSMLPTLTEEHLRGMKIQAFGDIFSIMKHAREVCVEEGLGEPKPGPCGSKPATAGAAPKAPEPSDSSAGLQIVAVRSLSALGKNK